MQNKKNIIYNVIVYLIWGLLIISTNGCTTCCKYSGAESKNTPKSIEDGNDLERMDFIHKPKP